MPLSEKTLVRARVYPLILMGLMLGLSGYVFQWTNLHGTWGKEKATSSAFTGQELFDSSVVVQ